MSNTSETPNGTTEHLYPSQGGGKEAINRLLEAYQFKKRQELCDHLGVSQSTLANRWSRDTFPHDWLIACHLDTGVPLLWLATGQGESKASDENHKKTHLRLIIITNGLGKSEGFISYDARLIQPNVTEPFLADIDNVIYLVDGVKAEVNDGLWLIEIDGLISLKELYRLPGKRIRVENGPASFECTPEDIRVLGKIVAKTEQI